MAAWRFMHSGSACMMIEFRSDHACIMHKSETDWMHARGQPASARAWPAASGQLAGWRVKSGHRSRALDRLQARANALGAVPIAFARAWSLSSILERAHWPDFWGTQSRHDMAPIVARCAVAHGWQ